MQSVEHHDFHLSIIIIALNEADIIEAQLAALAPFRTQGAELIVVDGGSQDATVTLAIPLADQVLISAPGRARQMNHGAQAARSMNLLFLHADTRLPANATEAVSGALINNMWGRFNVSIQGRSPLFGIIAHAMNLRSRLTGIATGDQAIFMTFQAFNEVGGFPDQPLMEDVEISRRLKRLSPPTCLKQRVITDGRRWEKHGVLATIWLMWQLRWRYWRGASPQQLAEYYRHVR
uniref:TIGR04283 family arsenosugar biosynthesis glycosyltransferase n=1 Tax=Halomonas sp. TaxID=1486246 RepID=UPI0026127242|nr:TIGR04283 family arsenosugar biosynthesis glycosyltransferase [Halomonas sp.]